jgi:hypothetical protein
MSAFLRFCAVFCGVREIHDAVPRSSFLCRGDYPAGTWVMG